MAKKLGALEECRKRELKEAHHSREKYALMEREYAFYKDLAEKLESSKGGEHTILGKDQGGNDALALQDLRLKNQALEKEVEQH
mmetsp:Transcript_13153/g.22270  ORF Transcript_13153/g.22270 Transcript_13153/m.22270 type:complete len:84 (+) Transcript_13153:863-1114(+)